MTPISRSRTRSLATAMTVSLFFAACAPSDADLTAAATKAIGSVSGVTVAVTKGVATIAGQFADSASRTSTEGAVKEVKGVTSLVDNATVAPPPKPVVISPDDSLKTNVMMALKDYSTLTADVKDGVVTLGGEIKKTDLPKAMQALSALHPKKIENKATVKK